MKPTKELKESSIRRIKSFRNPHLDKTGGDKNDEIDDGSSNGDSGISRDDTIGEIDCKKNRHHFTLV